MSMTKSAKFGRFMKFTAIALASAFALTACGESAADSGNGADATGDDAPAASGEVITLTGVPAEEAAALVSKFELLMEVIESETGREVEFQSSTNYATVIEA
ncbi:MAG: PhnD/SsuA/transferrin family substrate-binding protein, partial [Propionibacterium sp.]|nr:PhnD/SsuA/transferrin family substrate-binding protein [Propionibacterium sp.]